MPNIFAYVVFWSLPLLSVLVFRRLPPATAVAATVVTGYLFVPTQIRYNLPMVPAIDRDLLPVIAAFIVGAIAVKEMQIRGEEPHVRPGVLPRSLLARLCMLLIALGPIGTVLTNGDRLVYGDLILPALRPYDAGSMVMTMMSTLLPFIVARKYIAHPSDHVRLLVVLAIAGLVYSLPTLWEVRMSPQLNRQIFGFFPSSWFQHLRGGGFRPLVFLEHGLRLGIFLAVAVAAAAACSRVMPGRRTQWLAACGWLMMTLVLAKTFGALLITMAVLPIVLLCGLRAQIMAAAVIAAITITYPILRSLDLVPTERILSFVESVSEERRRNSLAYRFTNEDLVLEKVSQRPLFGWGPWDRLRVFDTETGEELSTALDGVWVITFGNGGWARYLGQFGLITFPILALYFRRRSLEVTLATSGLALALAVNLIDLLPNSGLTAITWLMAGALAGRLEVVAAKDTDEAPDKKAAPVQASPYRRSFDQPVTHSRGARRNDGRPEYRSARTTET